MLNPPVTNVKYLMMNDLIIPKIGNHELYVKLPRKYSLNE